MIRPSKNIGVGRSHRDHHDLHRGVIFLTVVRWHNRFNVNWPLIVKFSLKLHDRSDNTLKQLINTEKSLWFIDA